MGTIGKKGNRNDMTTGNDVIDDGRDVVDFLKKQHKEIKVLFKTVIGAGGNEREATFYQLRRLLAVHETAEELVVHPAARSALANGRAIVDSRLREENDAKHLLADLEKLDIYSSEFQTALVHLQTSVLAHAEAEEREEFNVLAVELDRDRLEQMRKAVRFAQAIGPTRPHPGVESAAANLLVGPFAAMLDRIRDAVSGKR